MNEPTVQVPVSLIEATIETADQQGLGSLASEYRALLSQPPSTAVLTGGIGYSVQEAARREDERSCRAAAEPPRIEDMAPAVRLAYIIPAIEDWAGHVISDRMNRPCARV